MQVFRAYFKIVKKFSVTIFMYFGIFLFITLVFSGNSKNDANQQFKASSLKIAVVDRDNSKLSKSLKDYLGTVHHLVDLPDEKERLQEELFYRNVAYILIIPENFSKNFLDGNANEILENIKVPDSYTGVFVDNQVDTYLNTLKTYCQAGYDEDKAITATVNAVNIETKVSMSEETSGDDMPSQFYYYQYLPYVFLCILIVGMGPILITFRKKDLSARNRASAMPLRSMNTQLALGSVVFAIGVWAAFILTSILIYGADAMITVSGALQMLNGLVFIMFCIALATLVSVFVRSLNSLNMVSNIVGLGMSFLCGIFVPRDVLSKGVLTVAKFLPAYWYVDCNDLISNYEKTKDIQPILMDYGIQLLFAVAIFAIAMVATKVRVKDN